MEVSSQVNLLHEVLVRLRHVICTHQNGIRNDWIVCGRKVAILQYQALLHDTFAYSQFHIPAGHTLDI